MMIDDCGFSRILHRGRVFPTPEYGCSIVVSLFCLLTGWFVGSEFYVKEEKKLVKTVTRVSFFFSI